METVEAMAALLLGKIKILLEMCFKHADSLLVPNDNFLYYKKFWLTKTQTTSVVLHKVLRVTQYCNNNAASYM